MIIVQYGSYVFPLSPTVTISTAPIDGLTRPAAYRKTARITGELFSQDWPSITPEVIAAARKELEQAFKQSRDLRVMNSQSLGPPNLLDAIWSTTAIAGVNLEGPISFPPGDGSEYATHLPFELTIAADYTVEHIDKIENPVGNPLNPPTAPVHNVYGDYTIAEEIQDGTKMVTASGKLRGTARAMIEAEVTAIANALGGNMQILRRLIEYRHAAPGAGGGFKSDATFSIQAVDISLSRSVFEWHETIEFIEAFRPIIIRPVLGGYDPVFQEGPKMPSRVIQSGSAKGRTNYPAWPARRFTAIKAEADELVKESPILGPDGTPQAYPIRWKYTGVSANNIGQGFSPGPLIIPPTPASAPA